MTIGQAARAAGVGVETIRFYEREGFIDRPPKPLGGGYRRYPSVTVERVRLLRQAQGLGFSLREAAALLDLGSRPGARAEAIRDQAVQKLADVDRRLDELGTIRSALVALLQTCPREGPASCCSVWQALSQPAAHSPTKANTTMPQHTTLAVEGMQCDGCVRIVQQALEREPGVQRCIVSLEKGQSDVTHDPEVVTPERLAETLLAAGYRATVVSN